VNSILDFLFVVIVLALIGLGVFYLYNLAQVTVTRKVKVVDKRTSMGGGLKVHRLFYSCTFEFEDGQREEYNVGKTQYALIAHGDRGELDTKGVLFWGFRRETG
jgi:hypothetical protein